MTLYIVFQVSERAKLDAISGNKVTVREDDYRIFLFKRLLFFILFSDINGKELFERRYIRGIVNDLLANHWLISSIRI